MGWFVSRCDVRFLTSRVATKVYAYCIGQRPLVGDGTVLSTWGQAEQVSGILIIGYGNLLRGDEAIGCHAAHALEEAFREEPEVEVIASQQLMPEMADDVARSGFVLFLDASQEGTAGALRRAAALPEPGPGGFS